jgi:putative DNA primase/helicase
MSERTEGPPIASPDDTLAVALSLAAQGWPVFPVKLIPVTRTDGTKAVDKRPLVKWHEGATTDADLIRVWWASDFPGAWVGVHAGRAGIVVVDVDLDKGKGTHDGKANLKHAGIDLPKTLRYKTRSGGSHHVYAAPEGARLTIGRDHPVLGVDIRAGNGLMVYYGPALTGTPTLAPAPKWACIPLGESTAARGADGDVGTWLARTVDGKPSKPVSKLLKKIDDPNALDHDGMLEVVTGLIKLGTERGVGRAFEATRAAYLEGRPDRARDWDNAAAGSIGRLGVPPATLELTKVERKAIAQRNQPEAVEKRKTERVAEYVGQAIESGEGELTDASLAESVALELQGKWAHAPGVGLLHYTGVIWQPADEAILIERVRRIMRRVRADETRVAILRGDKNRVNDAKALEQRTRIVAVARLVSGILLDQAPDLDGDPDVLNTPTCVVDLRTGETRDRRPGDYFTKVTAAEYRPDAVSEDWSKALEALPRKTREWLAVRFGQAATGRISADKAIPFLTGNGDNGKSAIVGSIREALGSYAVTVPERLLLGSENDHPTDIMTLEGARLAVFEELPRGGRLNAQRIKLLSGTNKLSGRRMRMDFREFRATHTLAGATNHLPIITDVDDAIWARMAPVPFPYKFVEGKPRKGSNERRGDPGLRDRLAESPDAAVLAWLVRGAVESYKGMPPKPPAVVQALEDWRGEADPVLGFVRDYMELDEGAAVIATDLYAEFGDYLEGRGQQRWSDQLIATSFTGHSSLPGVVKKQVVFTKLEPSRPPRLEMAKAIPPRPMSWVGVRFKNDTRRIREEAEREAQTVSDLEQRLNS